MPLLAERARRIAEMMLRAIALTAIAALFWRALRPPTPSGVDVVRGAPGQALKRWTVGAPSEIHVALDAAPSARSRDWLRALAHAGTRVRWSAERPIAASAVVAEPAVGPDRGTRLRVASSEAVSIGDAAGLIDTLSGGGAAELELASLVGGVRATGATFAASTTVRDTITLRPVLVLGVAGWESKFTIAALEERGWQVASRLRVAPAVEITQPPLGTIDTSRYSAVIALDSSAASSADAITRYARAGGGVVLAGGAARLAAFASIAPGAVGKRVAGVAGAVASSAPRTGLGVFPVASIRNDAIALESRDEAVAVAARRVNAGRVLQSGYDETWRWRMAGGDASVQAHREWWSRLVSAVAYTPITTRSAVGPATIDDAPLASLVDALGNPTPLDPAATPHSDGTRTTRVLFGLALMALLLEWTSRRLRGAR